MEKLGKLPQRFMRYRWSENPVIWLTRQYVNHVITLSWKCSFVFEQAWKKKKKQTSRFRADQIILWLAENYSGHVTETSIIFHIRKMFNIKKIQLNKACWGEMFTWNIRNQNFVKCVNYAKKNSCNHSISFQTIYSKMNKKLLKPLKYSFWAHFSQFRKNKFFKPLYSFEIQKKAMRRFWEISLTDRQTIGQ